MQNSYEDKIAQLHAQLDNINTGLQRRDRQIVELSNQLHAMQTAPQHPHTAPSHIISNPNRNNGPGLGPSTGPNYETVPAPPSVQIREHLHRNTGVPDFIVFNQQTYNAIAHAVTIAMHNAGLRTAQPQQNQGHPQHNSHLNQNSGNRTENSGHIQNRQ